MGMGFGSNYADVIEFNTVKKLCPKEAKALEKVLKKYKVSMEGLAKAFQFEEPDMDELHDAVLDGNPELCSDEAVGPVVAAVKEIQAAYQALQKAFAVATERNDSHLDLAVGYHNAEDDGDRYDEVNGVYWAVDGMYQLTPAGKLFADKIERKFFVTFG